jgi:1-acyl-sn-glycerol-3-phosphate acyltransferase
VRLRLTLRLCLFSAVAAAGFAAVLLYPALRAGQRLAVQRCWSRCVLAALGVRLHGHGTLPPLPVLMVANHVSWLDVLAISALRPATFVCKDEIAAWPAIGWLLRHSGVLFLRRGSARSAWRTVQRMTQGLADRQTLVVFPESTTTPGSTVLPFRTALFQPAVASGYPVQPLALMYSGPEAGYVDDTSFFNRCCASLRAPG